MRIALDGRVLGHHFPGIGRHVRGLAHGLGSLESEHELLLLVSDDALQKRWQVSEIADLRTVADRPSRALLPRPPRRLAREMAFDLFHATHFAAAGSLACKTVVTVYDVIPLSHPSSMPSLPRRLAYRWMLGRALRNASRVLTLTEAAKRDLVELLGVDSDAVVVTSAAVDPGLVPPRQADIERVRRLYGLPDRFVLHLASSRPHKNLAGLLEAWRELAPEMPGVSLVLAGPGEASGLRGQSPASSNGIFALGRVPEADLWPLYGGAEVYLHASLAEGFGFPVLEAMACGTPVCCSEIPALAEVTGEAAARFDPRDPAAMAKVLAELLRSPSRRDELGRRGRARAELFEGSQVARRTMAAYEDVLSTAKRAR